MAPVSIPDMAGSSSSSSGCSSSKTPSSPTWPDSVQMRLKELESELEDEEITKKGFWKQKFNLVEVFLNKHQVKMVSEAQANSKAGKLSDKEYFAQLEKLLVPAEEFIDEGVKDEKEAMNVDEDKENKPEIDKNIKEEKKEVKEEGPSGDSEGASSSGSGSSAPKREKNQPSIMSMFKKATVKKEDNEKKRKSSRIEENNVEKKAKLEESGETATGDKVKVAEEKVSIARCTTCRQLVDSPDTIR